MMNTTSETNITVTVIYEAYDRHGGGGNSNVDVITGKDELNVLTKISNRPSYGYDPKERIADGEKPFTPKELYEHIMEMSGDGCDFIQAICEGQPKPWKP